MAEIVLSHVKKVYPNESEKKGFFGKKKSKEKKHNLQVTDEGVLAVQDFNLTVHDHEFVVFVGPSGCGKSTTLRMIAGLEEITDGELLIDGKRMNDVAPKDRDIAMVFQSYALYPNMTVYQNMAFTLELKKVPKDVIDKKVRAAAETLGITQYLDRKPKALSGGQRQRVAKNVKDAKLDVTMGVRPEQIKICKPSDDGAVTGQIEVTELMGSTVHVHVTTPDGNFVLVIPANDLEGEGGTLAAGDSISFKLDAETIHVFDKQTGITLS